MSMADTQVSMANTQELHPIDQASSEELAEVITELQLYRERLVNDTLSMAQKAKVMKAQAMASLEPQLTQIDAQLDALRQRQTALASDR